MTTLIELKAQLSAAQANLAAKRQEMADYEISRDDSDYRNHLDEVYGDIEVCGGTYSVGYVLEHIDSTAFRCGLVDWVDSLDKEDENDYKQLMEEEEEFENEVSDLEGRVEDLEGEEEEEEEEEE